MARKKKQDISEELKEELKEEIKEENKEELKEEIKEDTKEQQESEAEISKKEEVKIDEAEVKKETDAKEEVEEVTKEVTKEDTGERIIEKDKEIKSADKPKRKKSLFKKNVSEDTNKETNNKETANKEMSNKDMKNKENEIEENDNIVVAPNITVEAPQPAVNNVKSEFQMPRKMKVSLSSPFTTFCIFLITLCVLLVCGGIGYGAYYVHTKGLDSILGNEEKVNLSDYEAMVKNYENVIGKYQDKLDKYEDTLSDYETALSDYKTALYNYNQSMETYESDYSSKIEELDGLITGAHNSSISDGKTAGDDELFTIYYQGQYYEMVQVLLDSLELEEDKDIKLESFESYDDMDREVIENADLIIYETASMNFEEDDILSKTDLGFGKKKIGNSYSMFDNIGLNADGEMKEFPVLVSPGYIQIRADLAKKYLGTTDPDELYEKYFCDMETLANTCNAVYKQSKGKVALFGSMGEVELMYENLLQDPDISLEEFKELTKGSIYESEMWSDEWFNILSDKNKNKKSIAVVGTVWFTQYILSDTKFANDNTILVKAPVDFYWGGACVAVPDGTSSEETANEIITELLDNTDLGISLFEEGSRIVNNKSVTDSNDIMWDLDDILYDQDIVDFLDEIMY